MEKLSTVSNKDGDVVTYLFQDGKHTLFVFDTMDNTSEIHTITFVDELMIFTYLCVTNAGHGANCLMSIDEGRSLIELWQNTQDFVNAMEGAE